MTLKYVFTGHAFKESRGHVLFEMFRSKVEREYLPFSERRASWEHHGLTLPAQAYAVDLSRHGADCVTCSDVGTMLYRLGYPERAYAELCRGRELSQGADRPLASAFVIIANDYMNFSVKRRLADLTRFRGECLRDVPKAFPKHQNGKDAERPIRIGYLSGDFYRHSAFNTWFPILREHDRSKFEVVCYHTQAFNDDYTASARAQAGEWRNVSGISDEVLADLIHTDCIDVLVDLAGQTAGNRFRALALCPAPIQLTAFGFVEGNGLDRGLSAHWGDEILLPKEERKHFKKKFVEIPSAFLYEAPGDFPTVAALPSMMGERFTFGVFNKSDKVNDDCLRLWKKCLTAVPHSRLMLKCPWYDDEPVRLRMAERLYRAGFKSGDVALYGASAHGEHCGFFDEVDVALDPFPYNGGITTGESLWSGVPVVTLYGQAPPGRVTAAMLYRAGLGAMIAKTPAQYVEICRVLGHEPKEKLNSVRQGMRARLAPSVMFNAPAFVRGIEKVYRQLWEEHCRG